MSPRQASTKADRSSRILPAEGPRPALVFGRGCGRRRQPFHDCASEDRPEMTRRGILAEWRVV